MWALWYHYVIDIGLLLVAVAPDVLLETSSISKKDTWPNYRPSASKRGTAEK